MTTGNTNFEENLKQLKNQYVSQLPEKIKIIVNDWKKIKQDWCPNVLAQLHRNVHSLIGTSGTFGFTALSTQARSLENALKPYTKHTSEELSNLTQTHPDIENKLMVLLQLTQEITGPLTELNITSENENHFLYVSNSQSKADLLNHGLICYLDSDSTAAGALIDNLAAYGFTVNHFTEPASMLETIHTNPPALVILNLAIHNYSDAWIFNLSKKLVEKNIKVFIFSNQKEFDYRLSAVRAHASSYILTPVDIPSLVNQIRIELNITPIKPAHILLIDDQAATLEYYSSVLAISGMKVDTSDNPLDVLDRMEKHRPDLIVLDINMPEVKGTELAAVIRQFHEYQSIPILFFSSDDAAEQKTELLEIGSDDLLQKGMPIAELVRQIKSRVERAKILSSFMYEDSLTGLLNHAQTQLSAEKQFSTAKRHKRESSIAMIDLDNFKLINDTWGHQTGDKVLKAFSQLCQQRLRAADIIGRYGGEEFMLVLPDTNMTDAGNLVNELRKSFSNIEFNENNQSFTISFSAGIAEVSQCQSVTEQIHQADEALYHAKTTGKNKVCLFSP